MKSFTNTNPRDLAHALTLVRQTRQGGRTFAFAGGGSDLLGMMKDRLVTPDVVVNLKAIAGLDQVQPDGGGAIVGGLITLDALSRDPLIRRRYPVLAEAAESVATPQIRNVGTLGGNLLQENRCPYYRGPWHCYRHGGMHCYARHGFNREHAIFSGDRCYVVSPSDLAPVIVAGNAIVHVHGPKGPRTMDAEELFVPASQNLTRMHTLDDGEVLTAIEFRVRQPQQQQRPPIEAGLGVRGSVMPIPLEERFPSVFVKYAMRNSFDFALASVCVFLDRDGRRVHRCRIALGAVAATPHRARDAEQVVAGNLLTDDVIHEAGRAAVHGAEPLELNAYKVGLVQKLVTEALQELSA